MNQLQHSRTEHPKFVAEHIAFLLDNDPVAAEQVKEHLKPERILELLALHPDDLRAFAGPAPDEEDEDDGDDDVRV